MGTTEEFAHFIHDTAFRDMPEMAVTEAKTMFLDTIGVALVGSLESSGRIAIKYAKEVGGNPEASLLGVGFRTSSPMAAFTNALLAHNLDYDDWLPAGNEKDNWPKNAGHASGILVPVALALGEKFSLPGRMMIEAFVIGIEVYNKIANSCPNARERGWHSMAIYGCMGAVATAAKLLGLDVNQITMALGIVASAAGGLFKNVKGYMTNPFHAGNPARAGVEAGLLAKEGFTSSNAIIESSMGFCDSFLGEGNCDYGKMTRNLGNPFHIVRPGLGIKPYPCAWPNFYAADGVLELVREHAIAYEDVQEVEVRVSPYHYGSVESMINPEPKTGYEARFSTNFICASALLDGKIGLDTFTDAKTRDPKVKEALGKLKIMVDERRVKEKGVFFAPVLIRLKDGREYSKRVDICKGHPMNPFTRDEILGKYRENAGRVLSQEQVARSIGLIENLEKLEDARGLMRILATRVTG